MNKPKKKGRRYVALAVALIAMVLVALVAMPVQMAHAATTLLAPNDTLIDSLPLLIPMFAVGALGSVTADLSDRGVGTDTMRQQLNKLIAWTYYVSRNGVISTTVATLPVVAIGGTASKVKTTNATVLKNAGVANALAASDDFWTLTGDAIVNDSGAAEFVRYLLCVSAADAASVIRSSVAATKAACEFPNLPADGIAIAGILTVEIADGTTFTPATTLLSAAGITDTYADGHDDDAVFALGGKLVTV